MQVKASLVVSAVGVLKAIDMTALKISTAYKLRKILNECQTAVSDFETRRIALAEEYGELDEEKNKYEFPNEGAKEEFQAKMKDMLDDELDIDIKPIHIDLIDDHITIEPANVDLLTWFIDGLDE